MGRWCGRPRFAVTTPARTTDGAWVRSLVAPSDPQNASMELPRGQAWDECWRASTGWCSALTAKNRRRFRSGVFRPPNNRGYGGTLNGVITRFHLPEIARAPAISRSRREMSSTGPRTREARHRTRRCTRVKRDDRQRRPASHLAQRPAGRHRRGDLRRSVLPALRRCPATHGTRSRTNGNSDCTAEAAFAEHPRLPHPSAPFSQVVPPWPVRFAVQRTRWKSGKLAAASVARLEAKRSWSSDPLQQRLEARLCTLAGLHRRAWQRLRSSRLCDDGVRLRAVGWHPARQPEARRTTTADRITHLQGLPWLGLGRPRRVHADTRG